MSETPPEIPSSATSAVPSAVRLNFVIGLCAIAISVASFYATYLQAQSAEQQVKAMTYPLIQFYTSNYDVETKERALSFTLKNSGVGPAIIRNVEYSYDGAAVKDGIFGLLMACCEEAMEEFRKASRKRESNDGQLVTSGDTNVILPANDVINPLYLLHNPVNAPLWEQLNVERRKMSVAICYCSLLDQCYRAESATEVEEVPSC
ncbi:MAG: hypothetical protein AAGA23_06280 [Pseudomonadota bacterium]